MIDLLLFVEIAWCSVFLGCRGRTRMLMTGAGLAVSGYVASRLCGWMTQVLVPPHSRVFAWVVEQVVAAPPVVSVLAPFLPGEDVAAGTGNHGQWLAYTLLKTLFFVCTTLAVFLLFPTISYLVDVYRPAPDTRRNEERWAGFSLFIGTLSGLYVAALTATAIAELSWLRPFSFLWPYVQSSFGLHLTATVLEQIHRTLL
jgi:hypothetical protein